MVCLLFCLKERGKNALACPVARWHVKLRLAGATPWDSGAIAYNGWVYTQWA